MVASAVLILLLVGAAIAGSAALGSKALTIDQNFKTLSDRVDQDTDQFRNSTGQLPGRNGFTKMQRVRPVTPERQSSL